MILGKKEYKLPKVSVYDFMDYADARNNIEKSDEGNGLYTRQDIDLMAKTLVRMYGYQFTEEEMLDKENGLDIEGLLVEFMGIDLTVMSKVGKRMNKAVENFRNGK